MNESGLENMTNEVTSTAVNLVSLIPVKVLLAFINVFFNSYIIVLVLFVVKKRSFSNFLFMSGAIADLMIGLLSIPFMTVFTTVGVWPLGKFACIFWIINDFSIGSISIYSLLFLSIHRYLQIKFPFGKSEHMTSRRYAIIFVKWMSIYLFWGVAVLIITNNDEFEPLYCYFSYKFYYVLMADLVGYFLPVMGVFTVNTLLFGELHRKNALKRVMRNATINQSFSVENSASMDVTVESYRKSTATNQREIKATINLYVVASILIIFFALFCVLWPLKAECSECVSDSILEISYWMSYIYSSINPIVLLVFHEKFQIEFTKSMRKLRDKLFYTTKN